MAEPKPAAAQPARKKVPTPMLVEKRKRGEPMMASVTVIISTVAAETAPPRAKFFHPLTSTRLISIHSISLL